MSTIYLCIGTMKTGTTALQNFMRANQKVLDEQGFCYPFTNTGPIRKIKNRNAHFMLYQPEHEQDHVQQRGYQKLQELAQTYPNIILSEELIWNHAQKVEDFWPNVLENVTKIGCQLKVIVYLRRQDELIQSLWNHAVKMDWRLPLCFEDYISQERYTYFPLDYYSQLCEIGTIVGKENLIVRVYEKDQFEGAGHTIMSDLLHVLGLEMTEKFTIEDAPRLSNPGLKGNFIEMKRILNGIPEYREMPDFMRAALISANIYQAQVNPAPRQSLFTPSAQTAFLGKYAAGNRKIAEEFLGRADGILFREPTPDLLTYQLDQNTLFRDLLTFTAEMFCQQQKAIYALEQKIDQQQKLTNALEKRIARQSPSRIVRFWHKVRDRFKRIFRLHGKTA